jgi:Bacterial Ig-like domain/FG-GAP-like repeat
LSVTSAQLDAGTSVDLVATKASSNVVSVLKGNGDGTFQTQTAQSLSVGVNPSAVTSADLDGDTKADDLAVSNYGSNDVSVLFNNDSGGFQAARSFPAGNGPAFVIGADFDADSFADLAVANQNSNNVSVLLNTEVVTTAPVISNVSPADKSQNVPLATNVEATFSEDMDPSTLTTSTFTLTKQVSSTPVGAQVSYDSASKKATLDPTSDLEANTTYTATIKGGSTGAQDLAGNALAQDYTWTFTTAAPAAPTAIAPTHTFTTLSTLGTSTVPVKLTWSATDTPGGSGIASYQLQQSVNGGAFTDVALPSATATTISAPLAPGTNTYRYRVAAKDNAGNVSAWATGPSFKVTAFQESSSAIVDTGSWTTSALSGAYGGSVQYASALGRNATFTVPAGSKNVEWVSYRGNRGKAQVWLDGVQQDANPNVTGIQPFDLYSSTAQARKVVFSKAVSATTSHKLEVRVLGKKNASSTSTRVDIDAFVTTS